MQDLHLDERWAGREAACFAGGGAWGAGGAGGDDPYRGRAIGMSVMLTLTLPALLTLMVSVTPEPPRDPTAVWAEALGVPAQTIIEGRSVYASSCAVCHGGDAQGVPRLGKPLRNSSFVQEHADDDLLAVIANGRLPNDPLNTTGAAMPARGAQGLSDGQMRSVVAYLRTLQEPGAPTVSLEQWIVATGGSAEATGVGRAGGVGHDAFVASCSACHGARGEGLDGLGKALAGSDFIMSKSDPELIAFIKTGRPIWDPDNTSGLDMPPRGGNPALSDEQLESIVKYIRTLHAESGR